MFDQGKATAWVPESANLVETLLGRGADGDMAEAEAAIERLAAAPADEGLAVRDIWLLRLRPLVAEAHGDEAAYPQPSGSLPPDGEIAWLRRTYSVGRGDAMTMVTQVIAASRNRRVPIVSKLGCTPRHRGCTVYRRAEVLTVTD